MDANTIASLLGIPLLIIFAIWFSWHMTNARR